jgi:hypothetical protein
VEYYTGRLGRAVSIFVVAAEGYWSHPLLAQTCICMMKAVYYKEQNILAMTLANTF